MEQQQREKSAAEISGPWWARAGRVYWAIFTRSPKFPIVHGSHYGAGINHGVACQGNHGHVYATEGEARERLALLPTNYSSKGQAGAGAPIGWEVGRVMYCGGSSFYEVERRNAGNLRPGMRVNIGTVGGGDYWQTIARIWPKAAGPRYSTWYVSWEGAEDNAAPSIISDARGKLFDVLVTA